MYANFATLDLELLGKFLALVGSASVVIAAKNARMPS
jgi:hypothetical protein